MNATLARLGRLAMDLGHEPDSRLLERFLGGCERSFRELVYRHGPLVFGVCNRVLRHRQDAEDAFQAVFLVLARRAADVWPREAVASWLHGVAYRVALKARGKRAQRTCREVPLHDVRQPETQRTEPDLAEIVERAVRQLPQMYRAAIVACDLEGLSRKDAAGQLGWSEGTLSGRLARARKLLAKRLRNSGLSLPLGGLAAVLGTRTAVRAAVCEQVIEFVSGSAECVPAPVAQLTEGVVSSMFAFKLKAMAAAALVACTIGYGAWAAGAGEKPGIATDPTGPNTQALVQGQGPAEAVPTKKPSPLDALQGKWRIISIGSGQKGAKPEGTLGSVVEINGATLSMPYRETGGNQKTVDYKIAVDAAKSPKTIDLIASNKPVGKGIYEITAPGTSCVSCHKPPWGFEPKSIQLGGLCEPALKDVHSLSGVRLKLAIAANGKRPTKFGSGDEGVIEFDLERVATDEKKNSLSRQIDLAVLELEYRESNASVERGRADYRTAQAALELAKVQYEKAAVQLHAEENRLKAAFDAYRVAKEAAESVKNPGQPPKKIGEPTFTIHIRTKLKQEQVLWVMAKDVPNVLAGLAYSAKDMALKPDALTVWIVRDKKLIPVDLAAIFKGDTKTNYSLKAGDRLFIEAKEAK